MRARRYWRVATYKFRSLKKAKHASGCTLREMHVSIYFRNRLREIENLDQNDRKCNDTFTYVMEDNAHVENIKEFNERANATILVELVEITEYNVGEHSFFVKC